MSEHLLRARLLYEQSRYELAEKEARQALVESPNLAMAHAWLALSLRAQDKLDDATREAQAGIHLEPDESFHYFVLGCTLFARNHFPESETAVRQAIEIEPTHVVYHSLLASIHLSQRRWQAALDAADQGLSLDPEDSGCINARAMALVKLGRKQQAGEAINAALELDPDNALTHTNRGWNLLQQGQPRQAIEHFREALRLDPELDFARAGIVESLKARNFLYRWMLGYFLWISRFSEGAQWGIMIGAWLAYRALASLARNNPGLAVWIQPLLWLYIAFAVLTWISDPVFNLLLRLSRDGRLALSRDQIRASNGVAVCLATAAIFLVMALVLQNSLMAVWALMAGLMVLPVGVIWKCDAGWPRTAMTIYTLGMLALLIAVVAPIPLAFVARGLSREITNFMLTMVTGAIQLFLLAAMLCPLMANWLIARTPRR